MTRTAHHLIVATAAAVLASLSLVGPSTAVHAATKTTRKGSTSATSKTAATKQTAIKAGLAINSGASVGSAATTTVPAKRSAGLPLDGWERIAESDWPAAGEAVVASAIGDGVDVLRAPGDRSGALRLNRGRAVFGPVRLLALGTREGYVRVALPIRPNGSAGWVRSDEVRLEPNTKRIVVDLDDNQLTVFDKDVEVLRTTVAAGTGGTPTPTGLYFLKELVPQSNPQGSLGPFAFGLSAFSDKLFTFNGGEGVIGIHGTNAPGKLGENVSHGCIRMSNDNIVALTKLVGLGTPVEIVKSKAAIVPSSFRTKNAWLGTVAAPSAAPAVTTQTTLAPTNITTPTPVGTSNTPTTSTVATATPATESDPTKTSTPTAGGVVAVGGGVVNTVAEL